jgi:hypothetical protein
LNTHHERRDEITKRKIGWFERKISSEPEQSKDQEKDQEKIDHPKNRFRYFIPCQHTATSHNLKMTKRMQKKLNKMVTATSSWLLVTGCCANRSVL